MVFQPNQSGNPGGRPKAAVEMARLIREATADGAVLVAFALEALKAKDAASRNYAHQWLSDRGFGKALQTVDVLDTAAITPEQMAMLNALHMTPHERRARIAELRAKAAVVATGPIEGSSAPTNRSGR